MGSIDDVPLLIRREIEARVLAPFVDALSARFGREIIVETLRETIQSIAREHGQTLAATCGGTDLKAFERVADKWRQGGALELNILHRDEEHLHFDVTRCRYAEMYHRLGIPQLGEVLSCGRDFVASQGFNPELELSRTQTILGGATHCNFRYHLPTSTHSGDPPDNNVT